MREWGYFAFYGGFAGRLGFFGGIYRRGDLRAFQGKIWGFMQMGRKKEPRGRRGFNSV